jgi:hypothetical protein
LLSHAVTTKICALTGNVLFTMADAGAWGMGKAVLMVLVTGKGDFLGLFSWSVK